MPLHIITFLAAPIDGASSEEQEQMLATANRSEFREVWDAPPTWCPRSHGLTAPLRLPHRSFDVYVALCLRMWPTPIRVGIATGEVHHALAAMQRGLMHDLPFTLTVDGATAAQTDLVEKAAVLYAAIMADWKPSRAKAVAMMREVATQQEAAACLGIRQQSVSDALRAAHAKQLLNFELAVRDALRGLDPTAS